MLWVDNDHYYGPDRALHTKRFRDRRRFECGNRLPAMNTALLQLRMRTLEAEGARLPAFVNRLQGLATLARLKDEVAVMQELVTLAAQLQDAGDLDVRPLIYAGLDCAQARLSEFRI